MMAADVPKAPGPAGELREPDNEEARRMMGEAVHKVGERAHAAHSLASTTLEALNGLREVVAMHVKHSDKQDHQATLSRSAMHEKVNQIQIDMLQGFAAIEQRLTTRVAGNRSWIVALVIGGAGTLILVLLGVIGWLITLMVEQGIAREAIGFFSITLGGQAKWHC